MQRNWWCLANTVLRRGAVVATAARGAVTGARTGNLGDVVAARGAVTGARPGNLGDVGVGEGVGGAMSEQLAT